MKRKTWTAAALPATLSFALLAACSGQKGADTADKPAEPASQGTNLNASGMPIVKEPITLHMFAGKSTTASDWNDLMLWKEYEKQTNIHVVWDMIPVTSLTEKRNIVLAGGDYPDAFHTASLPTSDLAQYGQQGVFIKLNDLIDQYAPNLKQLLAKYPDVKKGITMPDGSIYSFPLIYDPEFKSVIARKLWIKQDWLTQLGLPEPQTTDDFYNLLKGIKEKGGASGAIPFGGSGIAELVGYFKGSFGLGNRGITQPNLDLDPATGKLRFIPADPRYKEMLEYIHKLYSEQLIDKDIFAMNYSQLIAKGSTGVYGVVSNVVPSAVMNQNGYVGAPVLKGPHGDQQYAAVVSALKTVGAFAITKNDKYPEATVRWLDYFYGEEGIRTYFMGFENVTYKKTADGQVEYVDDIARNPKGLSLDQAVSQYLAWPGGGYPSMVKQNYFKGAEGMPDSLNATKKLEPYMVKEVWPQFTYTAQENEKLIAKQADIETYVNEMLAKFITGNTPLSDWDKYVATLNKMGLEEYMSIQQAAYERYKQAK